MVRFCTFVICLLISFQSIAQDTIANQLTKDHMAIPGTKVSLVPPIGFSIAQNYVGLQHNLSGASMLIVHFPLPFREMEKNLTKESFEKQGLKVTEVSKAKVGDCQAVTISGEQVAQGRTFSKYLLWFGTEKETVLVNASYPSEPAALGQGIRESLASIYYDPNREVNPFSTLQFDLDASTSGFKLATSMASSVMFNRDGKVPSESKDKTMLIAAKSLGDQGVQEDKKLFAINRLKEMRLGVEKVEDVQAISLDDISGYEIYADGKDRPTGTLQKVYFVMLFSDNLYYVLAGITNDSKENLEDIKRTIQTFKRR